MNAKFVMAALMIFGTCMLSLDYNNLSFKNMVKVYGNNSLVFNM